MNNNDSNVLQQGIALKNKLKMWVLLNVVLSFILVAGQLLTLGSMQQLYNKLMHIHITHKDYFESCVRPPVETATKNPPVLPKASNVR